MESQYCGDSSGFKNLLSAYGSVFAYARYRCMIELQCDLCNTHIEYIYGTLLPVQTIVRLCDHEYGLATLHLCTVSDHPCVIPGTGKKLITRSDLAPSQPHPDDRCIVHGFQEHRALAGDRTLSVVHIDRLDPLQLLHQFHDAVIIIFSEQPLPDPQHDRSTRTAGASANLHRGSDSLY